MHGQTYIKYQHRLRNKLEEREPHLHGRGNLKHRELLQSACMCSVRVIRTKSDYNCLVFITENCVYYAVRNETLHVILINVLR